MEKHSFRSPCLMNPADSALLVIDVQEKLIPSVHDAERIVWNIGRLISGAKTLGVSVAASEQYPRGLGKTLSDLQQQLDTGDCGYAEKTMFSCRQCSQLICDWQQKNIRNLVLTGIETHVCVAQTALDMISLGFNVFVCVDAVGTRHTIDHKTALRRLEGSGVIPTTTEAILFEWCTQSDNDSFKTISKLVQEPFVVSAG